MPRKKPVPHGRVKRRVNLTLDKDTMDRLESLKQRESLDSLSSAVRWLARTDAARSAALD